MDMVENNGGGELGDWVSIMSVSVSASISLEKGWEIIVS